MEIRVSILPWGNSKIDSYLHLPMGICTDPVAILVSLINLPVSVMFRSFIFVSMKKWSNTWEIISRESLNLRQSIVEIGLNIFFYESGLERICLFQSCVAVK